MSREKRTKRLVAHVPPSLHEQYELFVREGGNVISLSDYLFGVLEEHAAVKIVKQKIGRRVGQQ